MSLIFLIHPLVIGLSTLLLADEPIDDEGVDNNGDSVDFYKFGKWNSTRKGGRGVVWGFGGVL